MKPVGREELQLICTLINKLSFKQSITMEGGVLGEEGEGSLIQWITFFGWLIFYPDGCKTQVTVPRGFQNFLS